MGDPEGRPQPSGLLPNQAAAYADSFAKSRSIDRARWNKAEQCTAELIKRISGTQSSEVRRKYVADSVADIIRSCIDCKVFTFGSVPLKTYLPDGDIDLTIVSRDPRLKETWATSLRSALERVERSKDPSLPVKEVQYINAEVKLIKCHVGNIVVDISFHQLGGLCTLCFLEEVDRVIGRDHLFKRSIILIKAWCYYESTILGAHHGLISTYALETLVLYIFHVFHRSLRGPFEVLLRFLEFFGKFDWQKYAVSVWGPVPLSSLPEMIPEPPRQDGGELLLSKAFLDECLQDYAVFFPGSDNQGRGFQPKHLNIVDPLRAVNNLGRSVNQTNFLRIAKVLGHSAEKVLNMLLDPSKDIEECFCNKEVGFFKRTNERLHEFEEKRPDVSDVVVKSQSSPAVPVHHRMHQNGQVVKNINENSDTGRSTGAEPLVVDQLCQKKREGPTSDLGSRTQPTSHSQVNGIQGTTSNHLALSAAANDDVKASQESTLDTGAPLAWGRNESAASESSSYAPIQSRGRVGFPNSEAMEKPTGSSIDSSGGLKENGLKVKRHMDDGRDAVSDATQSCEQRDSGSVMGEHRLQLPVTSRSHSTQTDFESREVLVGSGEQHASESSRGNANLANEVLAEGMASVKKGSSSHSTAKDGPRRSSWVGEQPVYVDRNGALDGQGFVQHRGQDSVSRGPISVPVTITPHGQIPAPLPHPGQLQMHVAQSTVPTVPSTKGQVSVTLAATPSPLSLHSVHTSLMPDTPLVVGPRAGPYYATQRGPPPPPGYFSGPALVHRLPPMGEIANGGTRLLPSYPGQQGEERSFDQQVWLQIEQKQVRDHQHNYGYLHPVSAMSAAVPAVPPHHNVESSFVMSSAPTPVTSGPFHTSTSLQVPRTQVLHSPPGKSRTSQNGSSIHSESFAAITAGHDSMEDMPAEETGKSWLENRDTGNSTTNRSIQSSQPGSDTPGGRGSPSSKLNKEKEKKASNKSKSSSSEDTVDFGTSEDGMPSSSAESTNRWPAHGVADDTVLVVPAYPQLAPVPATGPALGPGVFPQIVATLPPHGNGVMIPELSSYPPPMVATPRITVGHAAIMSQAPSPSPSLSVGIPSGFSNSSRPPVVELGNGSSGRQRQMERAPIPPTVYYPPGTTFPYFLPYHPIYVLPQGTDPAFIQLDYGGLQYASSSNSFENGNDATATQAEELRNRSAHQARLGVADRLKAAGVSTSSVFKPEATATDARASEAVEASNGTNDLLSSNFSGHLSNLEYALWSQTSRSPVSEFGQPPPYVTPVAKSYGEYRPWEGPGRPVAPAVNMLPNAMSHGHGHVQGHQPSHLPTARIPNNFSRNFNSGHVNYGGDEPVKSYGGTGTYLPNPRPPHIRDRQSSGSSRNNHVGGYGQDRGERGDRDGNQVHGGRFRGSGRGQNKYEPRSQGSYERINSEFKGRDQDFHRQQPDVPRRNQTHGPTTVSNPGVTPPLTTLPTASIGVPLEKHPAVPILPGNSRASTSGGVGGTMTSVTTRPHEKRGEPLEFGSVGPVQAGPSQGGSEVESGAARVSSSPTLEQLNVHTPSGFPGLPLAASERSSQGRSSPRHRVMQRASFQVKEEDFPPLPFFAGSIQAVRQA